MPPNILSVLLEKIAYQYVHHTVLATFVDVAVQ